MKHYIELIKQGDKLCLYVSNKIHSQWPVSSLNVLRIKAAALDLYWELVQLHKRENVTLQPYIQGENIPDQIDIDSIEDDLTAREDRTDRVNIAYCEGVRRVVEEIKTR